MSNYNTNRRKANRRWRGFTLVELLVVIVIIGILASLSFVGGQAAMNAARRTTITKTIREVEMAVEAYKLKYGEYPPDFSDPKAVMQHVRKRWPRYDKTDVEFYQTVQDYGWNVQLNDDGHGVGYVGALAFWLGGPMDNSKGMLGGFSLDPSDPFKDIQPLGSTTLDTSQREKPMMELTDGKNLTLFTVTDANGGALNGVNGKKLTVFAIFAYKTPLVYFRPTASGYMKKETAGLYSLRHLHDGALGCAVPYAKKFNGFDPTKASDVANGNVTSVGAPKIVWHNPTSFQVISAGLDGSFGSEDDTLDLEGLLRCIDPSANVRDFCTATDEDNQANFNGTTIDSK